MVVVVRCSGRVGGAATPPQGVCGCGKPSRVCGIRPGGSSRVWLTCLISAPLPSPPRRPRRPTQLLVVAMDGVAPTAKMAQQRGRRFYSAHLERERREVEAAVRREMAAEMGPDPTAIPALPTFDGKWRHCLCVYVCSGRSGACLGGGACQSRATPRTHTSHPWGCRCRRRQRHHPRHALHGLHGRLAASLLPAEARVRPCLAAPGCHILGCNGARGGRAQDSQNHSPAAHPGKLPRGFGAEVRAGAEVPMGQTSPIPRCLPAAGQLQPQLPAPHLRAGRRPHPPGPAEVRGGPPPVVTPCDSCQPE